MSKPVHQTIVCVGSNIEPEIHIEGARQILERESLLIDSSPVIETEPVGFQDQPNFLNGAFLIETTLELDAFNAYLKEVENRLGRVKGAIKSGPRTIDLDIILWDGHVVDEDYYTKSYVTIPTEHLVERYGIDVNPTR